MLYYPNENIRPNAYRYGYTYQPINAINQRLGLGPELLTDGDMEAADTSAWTVVNNATLSKEAGLPSGSGTQVLRVAYVDTNNPAASQANTLTVGKTYRARGYGRGDGTNGQPRVLDPSGSINWTGTTSATWQYFDIIGTAGNTSVLCRNNTTGAGWAEFDNISFVEVLGA
jgi:hypothetical protein